jgi:hypothetical protein
MLVSFPSQKMTLRWAFPSARAGVKVAGETLSLEENRMLNVGNNLLGSPLGSFGALPPSLQTLANTAAAGESAAAGALSDGVSPSPQPANAASQGTGIFSGSGNSAGGYIQQFMAQLFSAFTQLAQYVSGTFGQPPWPGAGAPAPGGPGTPAPNTSAAAPGTPAPDGHQGQAFFTSATASSSGDPHDTFEGTTGKGQTIDGGRWNNMESHAFLLRSQSFDGGFHIATDATQPGPNGITRNGSATIDSDFGKHSVTMNRDGSYSITDDGQDVHLAAGQTQDLGDGESVTLNANNSLTVTEQNARGGQITTTLTAAGKGQGGVNVKVEAENVDLGGYLVRASRQSEGTGGPIPSPGGPGPSAGAGDAASGLTASGAFPPYTFQAQQPYEPGANQAFQAPAWSPEALSEG